MENRPSNRLRVVSSHVSAADARQSTRIASHYAEVNGVRIHYEKTGRGNHTLLLLPGAIGSSRTDFAPQLEKLNKEKYTIYAFDPRGYGRSIPPERDWPLEFLQRDAEDAVALMKTVRETRFSVLGWSDGGITGLIVAGRYPHLVRRLVTWGANAFMLPQDIPSIKAIEDVSMMSPSVREPMVKLYGRERLQTLWSGWVHAIAQYGEKRAGNLCIEETKSVRCPTLIVHGQKDPLVIQAHPDYLQATIPGSVLVNWAEGKHNLHLRYADKFNTLVEQFLDKDEE